MKKIILSTLILIAFTGLQAQQVFDTVYVQEGYTHQSYYSLANDEVANIINDDWDLAFESGIFGVSIRINGQSGTELYPYPDGDTSSWSSVDTADVATWAQAYDSDSYWEEGAFNRGADTSDFTDFGWGYYNTTTHIVSGDSLFVIKLSNGDFKKIWIQTMDPFANLYTFKYADIDGSNEMDVTYDKATYDTKNFGYYSLQNDEEVDREPDADTWDIVFTKYKGLLSPGTQWNLTGGLTNKNVITAEADGVDVDDAIWSDYMMNDTISTVGYDWKSFDFGSGEYLIVEDRCYFIHDLDSNIWKLTFTAFEIPTGMIAFSKEQVGTVGIDEQTQITAFTLYPNPTTTGNITIKFNNTSSSSTTTITDLSGKQVYSERITFQGEQTQEINVANLSKGMYIISIANESSRISKKLIIK